MNQYEFFEAAQATGLQVLTPQDVARITHANITSAYVFIHRLVARGRISPLNKGHFAICDDVFQIASQLVAPAYLSFTTALFLHHRLSQVINRLYVVTARKRPSTQLVLGAEIRFINFRPQHMFGFRKIKQGQSYVMLADLEKALCDCLYLPRYASISEVGRILREGDVDIPVFETYVQRMGVEGVVRRAGFLLEAIGYGTNLTRTTTTPYKLNPATHFGGVFNSKWRLYVNEGFA
ncbi:MAG TPA: hypothetical protein VKK79_24915 [Candidatus Lokiarchaeia archaeon]|nr:hypothetical protein [Candidatus Lokiarchaeia archaeon]